MPYVEGFGTWPFGEEWLWEAVASVYLPLLELLDGAPVTVGLTPVLCDQLEAMRGDAGRPLPRLPARGQGGDPRRGRGRARARRRAGPGGRGAARGQRLRARRGAFERCERDLLACFGALRAASSCGPRPPRTRCCRCWPPTPGSRCSSATGSRSHARRFGGWGGGLWLPECAYAPGLERQLADHGVRAFCVDQTHALGYGAAEQLAPVATAAGPLAVPIDWATVELVWGDRAATRSTAAYRDYHRRTIHDLRPWNNGGGAYDHEAALARSPARTRATSSTRARERVAGGGLLCCALDTELLGHWWYEGTAWLAARARGGRGAGARAGHGRARASSGCRRSSASCRRRRGAAARTCRPGTRPRSRTWRRGARDAELRTVAAAARANGDSKRSLTRAARELLALQSSDWAFMATRDLAADYPRERVRAHAAEPRRGLAGSERLRRPLRSPLCAELAPDLDIASLTTP